TPARPRSNGRCGSGCFQGGDRLPCVAAIDVRRTVVAHRGQRTESDGRSRARHGRPELGCGPMTDRPGATQWEPEGADVARLREAAQACRGCELYRDATQAVMGD